MGIKRIVDSGFWVDGKIDDFTPEEKYFYLYLLTGPCTTQLGIYELSIRQAAFHLGWQPQTVRDMLTRFHERYGLIRYSGATNEVALLNYLKHSIVKGGAPVRDCLVREIRKVKDKTLIDAVFDHIRTCEHLNLTVSEVIADYDQRKTELSYSNENEKDNVKEKDKDNENEKDNDKEIEKENDNDNDNDESYHESYHESCYESSVKTNKNKNNNLYSLSAADRPQPDDDALMAIWRLRRAYDDSL